MKLCKQCGNSMPDSERYCDICGTSLEIPAQKCADAEAYVICPACGASIDAGEAFCYVCGEPLESANRSIQEETPQTISCPGCGAVMSPDRNFCSKCGTSLGKKPAAYAARHSNPGAHTFSGSVQPQNIGKKLSLLGKTKIFYLASLITSLVIPIFAFFTKFSVTALGLVSESVYMWQGATGFGLVVFLLFAAAAACAALPLYTNRCYRPGHMIAGLVMKLLFALLFYAFYSTLSSEAARYDGVVEVGLNFGGWVIIIALIVGIAADIKTLLDIKKQNRSEV